MLRPIYMTIASIALSASEGLDVDRRRKSEGREKKAKDFCNLRDESHEMMVAGLLGVLFTDLLHFFQYELTGEFM